MITVITDNNIHTDMERRNLRLFSLLTELQTVSNMNAQLIRAQSCNTSYTYRVQHVVCHPVPQDSSAIKFDRVEMASISAFRAQSCNTSYTYRVQHVVCHPVPQDSSAIKFDRVEMASISAFRAVVQHILHLSCATCGVSPSTTGQTSYQV